MRSEDPLHIATLCFSTGLLLSAPHRFAVARIADPSDVCTTKRNGQMASFGCAGKTSRFTFRT